MNDLDAATEQIRGHVRSFLANRARFGTLSTGERIAMAVVLDRYDLIQRVWGTVAEAIYRLGPVWTEAALRVQRNGWQEDSTE